MTIQRRPLLVDHDELAELRQPRDRLLLAERSDSPDRFTLDEGPFGSYERRVEVGAARDDGRTEVTEVVEWVLAVPVFWVLYWPLVRRWVGKGMPDTAPWWAPAGRLDTRAARVIGLLGLLAIINGYLGTVIGQTLTFAADEFCGEFAFDDEGLRTCVDPDADKSARGDIFSIVRIAIVFSLLLTVYADRRGRRAAIRLGVTVACAATALGALAPSLAALTSTQVLARGLATGLSILVGVFATEELPPKSRAYGVSMLLLLAGLGSGMVVWILPVADVADWTWRIIYAVAAVFLPLAFWATTRLPTSLRFETHGAVRTREALATIRSNPTFRRRIALLGTAFFLLAMFRNPASQFDNDFLRSELGFSATRLALFTVVTSTPIGLGVMAGGIAADRIGRRPIGALGVAIGTTMTAWSFFADEPAIWFIRTVSTVLGSGLAVAALAVYGPELFPTRLRSTANGVLVALGVGGTVLGLQIVGRLAERWDSFGPAIALMAVGPAIVVVLILTLYPETAGRTLEELNDEPELPSQRDTAP